MIELSKVTLFIWMLVCAVTGGISLYYVDWSVLETGEGVFREFQTPILLLILSIIFMLKYVKKIKSEQNRK